MSEAKNALVNPNWLPIDDDTPRHGHDTWLGWKTFDDGGEVVPRIGTWDIGSKAWISHAEDHGDPEGHRMMPFTPQPDYYLRDFIPQPPSVELEPVKSMILHATKLISTACEMGVQDRLKEQLLKTPIILENYDQLFDRGSYRHVPVSDLYISTANGNIEIDVQSHSHKFRLDSFPIPDSSDNLYRMTNLFNFFQDKDDATVVGDPVDPMPETISPPHSLPTFQKTYGAEGSLEKPKPLELRRLIWQEDCKELPEEVWASFSTHSTDEHLELEDLLLVAPPEDQKFKPVRYVRGDVVDKLLERLEGLELTVSGEG